MERWLPIVGYEGLYEVSSLGRVRSLDRMVFHYFSGCDRVRAGVMLKPWLDSVVPYKRVTLRRDGKSKKVRVHVLVCTAFHGERPDGLVVTHIDGNPANNTSKNLAWRTQLENIRDMVRHGTRRRGVDLPQSKLTVADVRAIRATEGMESRDDVGERFGVAGTTIQAIWRRRTWAWLT